MAINQANKKKWNDTVEKLRKQLNLSDEEIVTIKEWGVALLVTGVSGWMLYRLVRKILGLNQKKVEIKVEQPQEVRNQYPKGQPKKNQPAERSSSRRNPLSSSSPWFPFVKQYTGPLMVLLAKQILTRYLKANKIIR